MRKLAGKLLLGSTLVFFVGSSSSQIITQNSEVLHRKPAVLKVFNPEKDESKVETLLFDPLQAYDEMMNEASLNHPRLQLNRAGYSYPGRTPTRPQSVIFTFIPNEKRKGLVTFSLSADNSLVAQGEVSVVQENKNSHQELKVAVPTDIFIRIAQARKVEFKIGPESFKDSYKLNDYQKKCVAALAGTIN
jgi:hypothetical protein